ncbi:transcriptional regulator [Clostridium novyi A str. 4552]|uniref:Transcriptional regulator n=1 Tax=Clostridium novyi A str. 4552 TaxID=1444289 RepID=A0A0A0HXP6_CLONO|nr:helix-turn-helix domain-containing protein [Clostridium novyi]KGM93984.1 transcriptional regulator [Clostridium novyi A str. 4552]
MKKGEILDKVYKSNLPSRAKQVMFYLINRVNAEGTCFPSVRTIASDCGVSERTIQRTMKVLIKEGFLIKEERYRDNGGQSSNLYKLKIGFENGNVKTNDNNKNFEEENAIEQEENKTDIEGIEAISFDYYKEEKSDVENNLEKENNDILNIVMITCLKKINYICKNKCHPMIFYKVGKKIKCFGRIPTLNLLCHGVVDNFILH